MTGIMIGFTRARHLLGTVYGNSSLTAADTGINAAGPNGGGSGDSTINLPATPYTNQAITINNVGTGTVTVSGNGNNIGASATTTIATLTTKWLVWGGYTWGFVTGSTCETVTLPVTKDFGTTSQGPAETAYSVPSNTVEYVTIGVDPCGNSIRRIITTTYADRSVSNQWRRTITSAPRTSSSYFTDTDMPDVSGVLPATQYASTSLAAGIALNPIVFPASFTSSYGGGVTWNLKEFAVGVNFGTYIATGGGITGIERVAYNAADNSSQLTIYYLDTHIVWTYDTI